MMKWLRALRLVLFVAAALVAVLFAASFRRAGFACLAGNDLLVSRGVLFATQSSGFTGTPGFTPPRLLPNAEAELWTEILVQVAGKGGAMTPSPFMWPIVGNEMFFGVAHANSLIWIIPLWVPFVALVIPWVALWWFVPSKRLPGHCRKCNYDLRSLPAGTSCPECGTKPTPARVATTNPASLA